MCIYISPKISYRVLRFVGSCLGTWPLKRTNQKSFLKLDFLFWFSLSNYALITVPIFYGVFVNRKNILTASYSLLEVISHIEVIAILVFNKYQKPRLKALMTVTEDQLDIPKVTVVTKYANHYAKMYLGILACYTIVISMYVMVDKPKSEFQTSLMTAVYPFNINSKVIKAVIYFNQAYTLLFASIILNFDGITTLLIFTLTDRFKLLESNFKKAKDYAELIYCIREHRDILYLVKETNYVARFIVLKTVFSFMSNAIISGLQILNNTAVSQCLHQFSIMSLVYARLYLCTESAENMTSAGSDIEHTIYSTPWYDDTSKVITAKFIIMQRCQKLPIISINGFMSALNRKYLGVILGATISYLTTLKTIVGSKY